MTEPTLSDGLLTLEDYGRMVKRIAYDWDDGDNTEFLLEIGDALIAIDAKLLTTRWILMHEFRDARAKREIMRG